jgi:hypothetical protein
MAPNMKQGAHVKGHQDRVRPIDQLEWPAVLNIEADRRATEAMTEVTSIEKPLANLPWKHCLVYLMDKDGSYTRGEAGLLRWKWRENEMMEYLGDRWGVSYSTIKLIGWAAFKRARRKMTDVERRFSTKLLTGWLASGTRMEKYGNAVTRCQRCEGIESNDHLLRCPAQVTLLHSRAARFKEYLVAQKTCPEIVESMVYGMEAWAAEETGDEPRCSAGTAARQPARLQSAIGWQRFMRGILAEEWVLEQLDHWQRRGLERSQNSAVTWSANIPLWLVREAHELWLIRCKDLHEPEDSDKLPREIKELHEQVRA